MLVEFASRAENYSLLRFIPVRSQPPRGLRSKGEGRRHQASPARRAKRTAEALLAAARLRTPEAEPRLGIYRETPSLRRGWNQPARR